jgi:hypothetical protein
VTFHKQDQGCRERCTSNIKLPVSLLEQDKRNELYGEADPEEDVELDQALKDLILGVKLLDLSISAKELVDLPSKLMIYLPAEGDICQFGNGDHDRKDGSEDIERNMRYAV